MLTKISQHEITCDKDGCETSEVFEEHTESGAENQAEDAGWTITAESGHYCPEHASEGEAR